MFVEDVILCALKECAFWNVSEYLLEHERCGPADQLAREIADRNELRVEPAKRERSQAVSLHPHGVAK